MTAPDSGLVDAGDGQSRCAWAGTDPLYVAYHDGEWGRPVSADVQLFEKICLEGFQAGLSWITILRKREAFRDAFEGFDPARVARFTARDVRRLLRHDGIVRHEGKIVSVIRNAERALRLIDECGSLAAYFWRWEPSDDERPEGPLTWAELRLRTSTPASTAMARDLKRRGWTFVGPTTLYAFMQAMGLVNDHLHGCAVRDDVERARQAFQRPAR